MHDIQSKVRGAGVKSNSADGFPGLLGPEDWPLVWKPTNSSALSIHRDGASPGGPSDGPGHEMVLPEPKGWGCGLSIVKSRLDEATGTVGNPETGC